MANYEKCWLHRCIYEGEGILNSLEDLQLQGNLQRSKCKAYSSGSLEKRKLDVKFISGIECSATGKLVAWLSHQKRLAQDDFSEREQLSDVLRVMNRFRRC